MAGGVRAKKSDIGARRRYGSPRGGVWVSIQGVPKTMHWGISPTGTDICIPRTN